MVKHSRVFQPNIKNHSTFYHQDSSPESISTHNNQFSLNEKERSIIFSQRRVLSFIKNRLGFLKCFHFSLNKLHSY